LQLSVVSGITDAVNGKRQGFRVNLRCHSASQHGTGECGGLKQGVPVYLSSTRTTLLECLKEVHNQVLREHGPKCIAASKVFQAERMAQENSQAPSQDALSTMIHLSQAQQCLKNATAELNSIKQRADTVNKEALRLEKAVDVAAKTVHASQKEVRELQAQLHPKRARIEADVEEEDEIDNVGDWTLPVYRREDSRVQNRRDVLLGSRDTESNYRTGSTGYLHHPRLGLIGWVSYWSRGHTDSAVRMIGQLIVKLGLTERIMNELPATEGIKEAETNAKIVELFKEALAETKRCRNEQQRIEYHIALGLVMPIAWC